MLQIRRQLIALRGGVAGAWSFTPLAQQPPLREIGYLNASSPTINPEFLVAFRNGLAEIGYVEDENLRIEYRWARDLPPGF
jgi:putative ABC transport system substrate-binding protein